MFRIPIFHILFAFVLFFAMENNATGAVFVKSEKCAICHIYDSIYIDKSIVGEGKSGSEREKAFCLSCHNGSVVDSKEKLLTGYQHPGVKMERFDKKEGRNIVKRGCAACHNPHTKIGWKGYAGTDTSIYTGGDILCVSCHQKFTSSKDNPNHPYAKKKACLSCHTLHGATTKSLLKKRYPDLCKNCHNSIFEIAREGRGHMVGKVKKRPVILTDRFSLDNLEEVNLNCYICHDLHEAGEKNNLLGDIPGDLCFQCHKGYLGSERGKPNNGNHPAAAPCAECHLVHSYDENRSGKGMGTDNIEPAIVCTNCHNDMVGNTEDRWNHITGKSRETDKICFRCHSMHRGVVGSPNLTKKGDVICIDCHREENTLNEQTAKPMAHPIFEVFYDDDKAKGSSSFERKTGKFGEIICRSCHAVHGAKNKKLLLGDYKDICSDCHDEYEVKHGQKKYICTECHYVHGITIEKGDVGTNDPIESVCLKCHGLRTGHKRKLSADKIQNRDNLPLFDRRGKRTMRGVMSCPTCHDIHGESKHENFLRNSYTGSTFLCVSCHPDKENVSLTSHDLRSVVSNSLCEPCHSPHHGREDLMWGLGDGGEEARQDYCFSCHSENGIAISITPGAGHPVNVIPRKKEGIPFTYYDLHWSEHDLGMIACPTCHDVHGKGVTFSKESRNGLLHLSYEFGEKRGNIERGKFCSSCHLEKKDMQRGSHGRFTCESCHKPHADPVPPEGANEISWYCLKCHKEVPAKDATVFNIVGSKVDTEKHSGTSHLLFDALGRHGSQGRVSCPSCHNIHSGEKVLALSFKEKTKEETCYACHPRKRDFEKSPHDLNIASGGGCSGCHGLCKESINREEIENIVDRLGGNPAEGKCLYCHSEIAKDGFYLFHPKRVQKVESSYGAVVNVESDITMVSKVPGGSSSIVPLFTPKGGISQSGAIGCLTCHDPHKGNKILHGDTRFLRDEIGFFISTICVPCHKTDAEEHVLDFHYLKRQEE